MALGQAPGDDDLGARLAIVREREDRLDGLLPGLLDERARVDDDEIGLTR